MIRPYEPTDLESMLEVWRRSSDLAHPFLSAEFQDAQAVLIRDVYTPMAETWVCVEGGRLVGFIALVGDEVGGLFVDPDFHGRGLGRALMDHARTLRTHLEVEVFEANAIGRRFYERYGFEERCRSMHEESGFPALRLALSS